MFKILQLESKIHEDSSSELIDSFENDISSSIEEISQYPKFYDLPLKNILSIISKVDFSIIENFVDVIDTLVKNTISSHKSEPEVLFLLQSIKCKNCTLSINNCLSFLHNFENSDIIMKLCDAYDEENKTDDVDYEYEYKNLMKELTSIIQKRTGKGKEKASKPNDYEPDIFIACEQGKLSSVKYLIEEKHINKESLNSDDESLIDIACINGHLPILQYLVEEQNMSVNMEPPVSGETPIQLACSYNHIDIVKYLIEKQNIDVNSIGYYGKTPLMSACEAGNLEIVKYLIEEKKADTQISTMFNQTALSLVNSENEALKQYLVEHIELDQEQKESTIMLACQYGYIKILQYIAEKLDFPPNFQDSHGDTPMHIACKSNHVNIVQYLIDKYKCSININNSNGENPFQMGINCNSNDVIKFLIERGHLTEKNKKLALFYGCEKGFLNYVQKLIENESVSVNIKEHNSKATPLHIASKFGQIQIVEYLIEKAKADPSSTDYIKETPLHYACEEGHQSIVEYLIEKAKVDISTQDESGYHLTPIFYAVQNGHLSIVKYFIENKLIDINNYTNSDGDTLLHWASRYGHEEIIQYLLQNGAKKSIVNNDNKTAFNLACLCGDNSKKHQIKKLLK